MTRQVIPSMLLSVLIVCFFSVLLHECERSELPAHRESTTPSGPQEPGRSPPLSPADAHRPSSPAETPRAPEPFHSPQPAQQIAEEAVPSLKRPDLKAGARGVQTGGSASEAAGRPLTGSRSAFTTVKEGESLEDVSIRVYGTTDQVDALWRVNRDLLPQRTSPLPAGAILRTPAF